MNSNGKTDHIANLKNRSILKSLIRKTKAQTGNWNSIQNPVMLLSIPVLFNLLLERSIIMRFGM